MSRSLHVRPWRSGCWHPGHGRLLPLAGEAAGGLRLPGGGGESNPQTLRGSVPRRGRGDTHSDTDTHIHTQCVIGVFVSPPVMIIIYLL